MEQNKSILLQKQVRDNTEDLQKELLDLKNWEIEMKRKEEELLKADNNKVRIFYNVICIFPLFYSIINFLVFLFL